MKTRGVSRRVFLSGSACLSAAALAGCQTTATSSVDAQEKLALKSSFAKDYAALPKERFPIPAVQQEELAPKFRRRLVNYKTNEKPGTLIVEAKEFYLYHVKPDGKAMRYGVGLGRAGFEWSGRARVAWKRPWPTWTPPAEMIAREPQLEKYSAANGGKPPSLDNPLGARALYIFEGNVDTLYRLHGTKNPKSIGRAISSGCVRLVNQDIIHLYNEVKSNAPIIVRLT